MKQAKLEAEIEALALHEHDAAELDAAASALPRQDMALRRQRKATRYTLYRLRTEADGGCAAPKGSDEVRAKYESQPAFRGWKNFALSWDVSLDDPTLAVARDTSEIEDWEDLMKAKFPIIEPGGRVLYPDRKVKRAVQAEQRRRRGS